MLLYREEFQTEITFTHREVPKDGDCFQVCVERHFKIHDSYSNMNIRSLLSINFSRYFKEVLAFIRGNEMVAMHFMSWFLDRRVRNDIIGSYAKQMIQHDLFVPVRNNQGKGKHDARVSVDNFFRSYKLNLEDAVHLLNDFTKTSARAVKAAGTTNYVNYDVVAVNLWFSEIHLDFLVFFRILDYGCILNVNKSNSEIDKGFKCSLISKTADLNAEFCSEKILFLICDDKHFDFMELHMDAIVLTNMIKSHNQDVNKITPIPLPLDITSPIKELAPLCFSKFQFVVRVFSLEL